MAEKEAAEAWEKFRNQEAWHFFKSNLGTAAAIGRVASEALLKAVEEGVEAIKEECDEANLESRILNLES